MKLSILIKSLINTGFVFGLLINLIHAAGIENRDSLYNRLIIAHEPSEKIVLLNLLAESYLPDNPLKAYNLALQAKTLSRDEGNLYEESRADYFMSAANYKQGNFIVAYNQMAEAQDGFKRSDNTLWFGKSCLELGKIYEKQYEFEKALESLLKASEIFVELGDSSNLAITFNVIGINYYDQKNLDKAYEFFQKALYIRLKIKDEIGLSSIYNNIGEIYRLKGNWSQALDNFNKAIKINRAHHRDQSLSINYDNMGNIYTHLNRYDSAYYYLNESLRLSKKNNDMEMASLSYINHGRLYRRLNDYHKSMLYCDSGFQIAQSRGYLIHLQEAAYELSEVYKEIEKFDQAYKYHKIYKSAGDSLLTIQNQEKIAQLEMKLIFDHEKKLLSLKHEKARYFYFLVVFGLISILMIFLLIYGRLKIKMKHSKIEQENLLLESQQLRDEIDFKNRELATNVMYLVKKNELINYISEKLLKTKSVFKKERQESVEEIILELQSNIDKDIWKVFEERFKAVHKEFYRKLNEKFPNLTENDKKLCALLRLNLSTKDIAAITHQNPNTIDVARTRLRKKMNLSNMEVTLVSYLENL